MAAPASVASNAWGVSGSRASENLTTTAAAPVAIFKPVNDWQAKAAKELGETPNLCSQRLLELRARLVADAEQGSDGAFCPRLDDDFLMRFLRTKKFDVTRAARTYCKYYRIRLVDPKRFMPIGKGPRDFADALALGVGTLLERLNPCDGSTTVIWRVGRWSPSSGLDLRDIVTPTAMAGDFSLADPQVQVNGVRFLIDFEGMHCGHLRHFPFSAIKALVMALQDGYPVRFKGFHVVHNSSLWDALYSFGRHLLGPKQRARIHLHGDNLESLHRFIPAEILPEEYGGLAGPFDASWIIGQLFARHDQFVNESYYGYHVQ